MSKMESRLNILLVAMLVSVIGMLIWIYQTIDQTSKSVLDIQEEHNKKMLKIEKEYYQTYKYERDRDFLDFQNRLDKIMDGKFSAFNAQLKEQGTALNQNASAIQYAAKTIETKPPVVIHHTEVISDKEAKRRTKAKEDLAKYQADMAAWKAKYGKDRKHKPK